MTALRMGRDGYRGIRTLADSDRVPESVRLQALRHLAADFPDRDVTPVLERALRNPALQAAALGSVMLRRDVQRAPVENLVNDEGVELAIRIRGLRFLASRWSKREVKTVLEAGLDAPELELRRVALECLFTSMRFVHPSAVEEGLINLLKEHDSVDVKISAAKALGAFGADEGLRALQSFTGLFSDEELKDAAQAAIDRIQTRKAASGD